jgi:predicted RNA binding protein YcfA (HicA-like mRNA interferase family)
MIASIAARVCIYTLDTVASSVYLYTMKSQDIIKALKSDGWKQVSQKGSHVQFKHPTKTGRVTVPHPNKDVPIGTLRSIEKQATIKLRRLPRRADWWLPRNERNGKCDTTSL